MRFLYFIAAVGVAAAANAAIIYDESVMGDLLPSSIGAADESTPLTRFDLPVGVSTIRGTQTISNLDVGLSDIDSFDFTVPVGSRQTARSCPIWSIVHNARWSTAVDQHRY